MRTYLSSERCPICWTWEKGNPLDKLPDGIGKIFKGRKNSKTTPIWILLCCDSRLAGEEKENPDKKSFDSRVWHRDGYTWKVITWVAVFFYNRDREEVIRISSFFPVFAVKTWEKKKINKYRYINETNKLTMNNFKMFRYQLRAYGSRRVLTILLRFMIIIYYIIVRLQYS